jgi:hypothetical protein
MEHFRRIGTVDVAPLVDLLPRLEECWAWNTLRQDAPGSPQHDTECIYLRMPVVVDAATIFDSLSVVDWAPMPHMVLQMLIDCVGVLAQLPPARVMLTRLKYRGVIDRHIDQGRYADLTERFHVPIISNPGNLMHCGDEGLAMVAGDVVWFDKHAEHWCENLLPETRVHLIVDCWGLHV